MSDIPETLRIPNFILRLQNCFFENTPYDLSGKYSERLFTAIKNCADYKELEGVELKFLLRLLNRLPVASSDEMAISSRKLMENWTEAGLKLLSSSWLFAASYAERYSEAAKGAAASTGLRKAAAAADAAGEAAAWAAWLAVWTKTGIAASSRAEEGNAAWEEAREAEYVLMISDLIELIEDIQLQSEE